MKKKFVFLLFLLAGAVTLTATYRVKEQKPSNNYLIDRQWKFSKAESSNTNAAAIINALYWDSQYNFTSLNTFHGAFFEKMVKGTWRLENSKTLILNEGHFSEERLEISKVDEHILELRILERGNDVTVYYTN